MYSTSKYVKFTLFNNSEVNGDIYIDGSDITNNIDENGNEIPISCSILNTKVNGTIYATQNIKFNSEIKVKTISGV